MSAAVSFVCNRSHLLAALMVPRETRRITLLGTLVGFRLGPTQESGLAHLLLLPLRPSPSCLSFAAGSNAIFGHDTAALSSPQTWHTTLLILLHHLHFSRLLPASCLIHPAGPFSLRCWCTNNITRRQLQTKRRQKDWICAETCTWIASGGISGDE